MTYYSELPLNNIETLHRRNDYPSHSKSILQGIIRNLKKVKHKNHS